MARALSKVYIPRVSARFQLEPDASPVNPARSAPVERTEPTEIVRRPDPGTLARGAWEAPAWAFYAGMAFVILAAALYAALRLGAWQRWKSRASRKNR